MIGVETSEWLEKPPLTACVIKAPSASDGCNSTAGHGRGGECCGVRMISQGVTHETLPEFDWITSFAWK